ncbi:hypothetical protein ACFV5E_42380 [Streptomyces chartreusis]|uniref:hypothetical protein n=1 Tax=Streptomyces chartreusis TaxID=1969 RepID=UPI0036C0F56A
MNGERKVWVGYQVQDGIADREGIITDIKGGMYVCARSSRGRALGPRPTTRS